MFSFEANELEKFQQLTAGFTNPPFLCYNSTTYCSYLMNVTDEEQFLLKLAFEWDSNVSRIV